MRTSVRVVVVGTGAALAAALLAPAAAAGGGTRTVQVRDECDPTSFNAALGKGACDPRFGGDTTVDELTAALTGDAGERAMADGRLLGWRNNPVRTSLEVGEGLQAVSRGGEFHTFSRVDELSGGCADPLNQALGLPLVGQPGNNCLTTPQEHFHPMPAGATVRVAASELTRGTNLYQCLIHPWMHTTVHVH